MVRVFVAVCVCVAVRVCVLVRDGVAVRVAVMAYGVGTCVAALPYTESFPLSCTATNCTPNILFAATYVSTLTLRTLWRCVKNALNAASSYPRDATVPSAYNKTDKIPLAATARTFVPLLFPLGMFPHPIVVPSARSAIT